MCDDKIYTSLSDVVNDLKEADEILVDATGFEQIRYKVMKRVGKEVYIEPVDEDNFSKFLDGIKKR